MITLQEFFQAIDYKITEGSEFGWGCFGGDAYSLDSWSGDQDGYHASVVFDRKDQFVYMVEACDYENQRAYRWIDPSVQEAYNEVANEKGSFVNYAWDDVKWIDLETKEDFLTKLRAIINGEQYDTRVQVPIELTEQEMLRLYQMAHERDVTLNELVGDLLETYVNELRVRKDK